MATTTPPDFLSVREAADVLRIGKSSAYDLANEFVRVGRQLRVPRTALEDWLGASITWPIVRHPKPGSSE
jgi:excisionase family DNA binding protein